MLQNLSQNTIIKGKKIVKNSYNDLCKSSTWTKRHKASILTLKIITKTLNRNKPLICRFKNRLRNKMTNFCQTQKRMKKKWRNSRSSRKLKSNFSSQSVNFQSVPKRLNRKNNKKERKKGLIEWWRKNWRNTKLARSRTKSAIVSLTGLRIISCDYWSFLYPFKVSSLKYFKKG